MSMNAMHFKLSIICSQCYVKRRKGVVASAATPSFGMIDKLPFFSVCKGLMYAIKVKYIYNFC